jgi:hypothetical protein
MFLRIVRICSVLGYLAWAILAGPAESQQTIPSPLITVSVPTPSTSAPGWTPEHTLGDTLRHLSAHAGTAFLGTVQTIELPTPAQPGVVTITFQVITPVLGSPGSVFTVHEWAGLWTLGRQRYTLGQRALFFFHPPNDAGLSSPVDGMEGIIPLIPTTADAPLLLDMRRLATRVLRSVGDPLPFADTSAITLTDAVTVLTRSNPDFEPTLHPLPAGVQPTPADPSRLRDNHIIALPLTSVVR